MPRRSRFRGPHLPGAWWSVRSRLAEARARIGDTRALVLTLEDGVLAQLAAPEAASSWPDTAVRFLEGGNAAWFAAGQATETGISRQTKTVDDVWYKSYDHGQASSFERHARDYLDWEVALVERIRRDPSIRFRRFS